jgi:PKD repeat protein
MKMKYGKLVLVGALLVLLVASLCGCMRLFNRPPVADFRWSPKVPYRGQDVTFNASDSYDPDGFITEWYWNFGDGATGTGEVVTHKFEEKGTYTVSLTVKDNKDRISRISKTITVENRAPVIKNIRIYGNRRAGQMLRFIAEAVDDTGVAEYRWDFGDKTSAVTYTSSVFHSYRCCGSFTITLVVVDGDGALSKPFGITIYIKPFDQPPTACFTINPGEIHVDDAVTFDAQCSRDNDQRCAPCYSGCDTAEEQALESQAADPECYHCPPPDCWRGRIVSHHWKILRDGIIVKTLNGSVVSFTPTQTGSYVIQLTVRDDEGNTDTEVKTIEVLP